MIFTIVFFTLSSNYISDFGKYVHFVFLAVHCTVYTVQCTLFSMYKVVISVRVFVCLNTRTLDRFASNV